MTNLVFITSVGYLSQPKLDMLWSVRFWVRKRIVKLIKCHEIALTILFMYQFTLSTWAVYVINLVGITSVDGLSQSILDMLWSEPFCVSIRYAQSFKHPKIDRTMLLLHHLTFSNRTVYMINPVLITLIGLLSQPTGILDMLWSVPFCVRKGYVQSFKRTETALTVLLLYHFTFSNRTLYVTNPVGITSVGGLSQFLLDMLWSEPFCICERYP